MLFAYFFLKKIFRDNGERDREIWNELNGQFDENPFMRLSGSKLNRWLIIANVMLDVGVNSLPPLYFYGGMEREFDEFVSILSSCNTHLKELYVTFQVRTQNRHRSNVTSMIIIVQYIFIYSFADVEQKRLHSESVLVNVYPSENAPRRFGVEIGLPKACGHLRQFDIENYRQKCSVLETFRRVRFVER